jgi:hypothetical protein
VRVSTLTFLDVGLELRSPLPYLTWDSARKKSPGTLGKMPTGAPTLGDLIQRGGPLGRCVTAPSH